MNYVDFEWKYYQFNHENQTEKSAVTFFDLPMDVLEKVLSNLALEERLVLRKVSHNLRSLVDSTEVHCNKIAFRFDTTFSMIQIEDSQRTYTDGGGGWCTVFSTGKNSTRRYQSCREPHKVMVADASTFLKNPKLKIDRCEFSGNGGLDCLKFLKLLKSLNFELHVQSVEFSGSQESVLPVLQVLKSGFLEEIGFEGINLTIDQLDKIAEMEQWKRAMKSYWNRIPEGFRMEHLLDFQEIRFLRFEFSDRNLIMIRDILLKSSQLESCYLGVSLNSWEEYDEMELMDSVNVRDDDGEQEIVQIMSQNPEFDFETRRFSILNSRDYFQLSFERDLFSRPHAMTIKRCRETGKIQNFISVTLK